jgi:putative ABC transport system substrate-binding protein
MLRNAAFALGLLALSFGLVGSPFAADVLSPAKAYRIGFLGTGYALSPSDLTAEGCPTKGTAGWQAVVEGLRERGYVPGRNLVIVCRYTEGHEERAPALAAELVNLKVDLLLAFSSPNVRAAKRATETIPIVMYGVLDPVRRGLVASLALPGGNVTGQTDDAASHISEKHLQLLKEAVPRASRVAVLGYLREGVPSDVPFWGTDLRATAEHLRLTLQFHVVDDPEELESAFAAMKRERVEALLVQPSPFAGAHAQRIVDLAARERLPAVYPGRDFVRAGGLMSYDADQIAFRRRIGTYVDKIFRGAKPADMPVEQPMKFELIVNLKTAKALGLTLPRSLLHLADETIE